MTKLLIIEHDSDFAKKISQFLGGEQYLVEVAPDGQSGQQRLSTYHYDLIVLESELPDLSGPDLCRTFRENGGQTPLLMISDNGEVEDKELGLDAGADDYLTKPFQLKELAARLRALRRRCTQSFQGLLQAGDLLLDPDGRTVTRNSVPIHLEPREFNLLEFLLRNQNKTFSAETLIRRVWESESQTTTDTLRAYIRSVRKKIDLAGQESLISTVHGVGYKIQMPRAEEPSSIYSRSANEPVSAR